MEIQEITLDRLDPVEFIARKSQELSAAVGEGLAINALSGGVDSSVVTALGHKALGNRLKTYVIDNGIMRKDEPAQIAEQFRSIGIPIEVVDAREQFYSALKGLTDPEEKREAITQTFYREVFGDLVKRSGARFLLQGTIFTDVEETVAGVKRQHNILSQLGIDTVEQFGYEVIEPLIELRKPGVRMIGEALGLPHGMYNRPPFPGPALAARIIGEVTPERVALVREATAIVEEELAGSGAFQYLAILHEDRVTGIRDGRRDYGNQIEVRCWESKDAKTATPTRLDYDILQRIASRMTSEVPGVVSVTYNITSKPTSTIEAI
ncbi:MAG TPA: asparagine synthase-related protein [Deltaproteobacteria bacterium]|jgi:GMP synthase (glutamine-hydrolysing)|nr:asparagine synthase-related protein [Deltaproteobacteria bacterium]HOI07630.1 asparagine synthase-related protein [Deltaproteobacteria bacterium]